MSPFPIHEHTLCRFVSHLSLSSLSYQTIRSYLSAIRYLQISQGMSDPSLSNFCQLEYVLKGIRRSGAAIPKRHRLPITPELLRSIHRTWSQGQVGYDRIMLWAAFTLAFFGFLRAAEFTCNPTVNPSLWLSLADIQVDSHHNPQCMAVLLRCSKTDQFGAGVTLYLGATGNELCPITAMLAFLAIRQSSAGPLFVYQDGSPLSRTRLVCALRQALSAVSVNVSPFSGHSFRIGAASTAAKVGIGDAIIKTLGRWSSTSYMSYIKTPRDSLTAISRSLAQQH